MVTGTVQHEIKKQESRFLGASLAPMAGSLVAHVASSLVKVVFGKRSHDNRNKIYGS